MEQLDRKSTFVCRTPSLDDLLPLNIEAPMHRVGHSAGAEVYVSPVTIDEHHDPNYVTFAQAAQAAFLLDSVIEHIYDDTLDENGRFSQTATIDQQLQTFLTSMVHQPKVEGLDACLAYTLAMRYIPTT